VTDLGGHFTRRGWLGALVAGGLIVVMGWQRRWINEDAFINFRVVEQIVHGNGPVFNAGERVEAFTSPLWLAVLVVVRAIVGADNLAWGTVIVGLAIAAAAFVIGSLGIRRSDDEIAVPIGLIAVASIPVVWDYSTSGLENAIVWLWLAVCWQVLRDVPLRRPALALAVIGLGPLLRPDLTLMTIVFLVALAMIHRPDGRRVVRALAAALAVPVLYQLFRMGYYAAMVPNTGLAKAGTTLYLGQGWRYFWDMVSTYWLWLAAVPAAMLVWRRWGLGHRNDRIATTAMLVAAAIHVGYICAVGGDYMHGRLLLPGLFATALPLSVAVPVRVERVERRGAVALAALALWSALCGVTLRRDQRTDLGTLDDISDRRVVSPRPLVEPIEPDYLWLGGADMAAAFTSGQRGVVAIVGEQIVPGGDPTTITILMGSIGLSGYNAGVDVHVVDIGGLAEVLAARSDPIPGRPAGHRKQISDAWYAALYGTPSRQGGEADVAAAEAALQCPAIAELIDDTTAPLTVGRFFGNIVSALGNTRVHVPFEPTEATCD
jgi:arabinofuranosyltransferase